MKICLAVLILAGTLFAQKPPAANDGLIIHGQSSPPAKKQQRAVTKQDPAELYWACGLGTRRDHQGDHCHCPAMVAEVNDEMSQACADKYGTGADNKPYVDCMSKIPANCDIVMNADLKHPAHTCKRSCNKNAICKCHDGPACSGPPIPTFGSTGMQLYGEDQQ